MSAIPKPAQTPASPADTTPGVCSELRGKHLSASGWGFSLQPTGCEFSQNPVAFANHCLDYSWSSSFLFVDIFIYMDFLVAQTVERLLTMQETRVQSLGREDLLEKGMATHSSILAWKIPRMEEPGRLESMGVSKNRTWLSNFTFTLYIIDINLLCIYDC